MNSWTQRNMQRGGTSQAEFLSEMAKLGFRELLDPRPGFLHEFEHERTGCRRYCMKMGESYTAALQRLELELKPGGFL